MWKAWLELLSTILLTLYIYLRGDVKVSTSLTGSDHKHKHLHQDNTYTLFISRQVKHVVTYARWWIPNRVIYSYDVELIRFNGGEVVDCGRTHVPHLCLGVVRKSTYAHECAIQAMASGLFGDRCDG